MNSCMRWTLILLTMPLAACAQGATSNSALQGKLNGALKNITSMEAQIVALRQDVAELKSQATWSNFAAEMSGIAYLTPANSGYSVIKIDQGDISIALVNVQPYANGSRITLQFGNPLAATLTGVTMTLQWGETDAKGTPDNADEKSRDVQLLKPLGAGSWTQESFVLDSIPASKLGFVRVTNFSHHGMTLLRQ